MTAPRSQLSADRGIGASPRPFAPGSYLGALNGLLYGLCVCVSLPPIGLWPMTLTSALVLIGTACRGTQRPARTSLLFGIGSLPIWFAEQFWLIDVTPVGYPLLALYHGAFTGLTVYLLATIRRYQRARSELTDGSLGRGDVTRRSPPGSFPSGAFALPLFVAAPLAWLATEFLRGEIFLSGYAWFLLAHPLIDAGWGILVAPAGVFGAYFVSFLAAALAGAVADVAGWSGRRRRVGILGFFAVAALWLFTAILGHGPEESRVGKLHVGVVQTNIAQGQKLAWSAERIATDFRRFIDLTRALAAAEPKPQLIVWPETMFPGISLNDRAVDAFEAVFHANNPRHGADDRSLNAAMVQMLRDTQREIGIPMLVGSNEVIGARMERDADGKGKLGFDAKHNSVVLIDKGEIATERYDKIELTPCGEFIPVAWRWPALQRMVLAVGAGGMKFDLTPGTRPSAMPVPGATNQADAPAQAATPICFEVTRSGLCRRLVYNGAPDRDRADLLINLSNDGWFGEIIRAPVNSDADRAQTLLTARWRCVELGVPMVRAVNTGISAAIDRNGQLLPTTIVSGLTTPTRTDGALIATVELSDCRTIFGRIGNVFGWTAMLAGWVLFGVSWWRGRAAGRSLARSAPMR